MKQEKQQLLKQHRRKKRVLLGCLLLATLMLGALVSWWLILALPLAAWIAHEAWFSDHLFYRAKSDYDYRFDAARETELAICQGKLLAHEPEVGEADTRIIELHVKGSWLSHFIDPYLKISGERFDFERGVDGRRFVSLSPRGEHSLSAGLPLETRHCQIIGNPRLHAFKNPPYAEKRVLIIAPHADDAELAAFGLYRQAPEAMIVTLTQGEIEAEDYERHGLDKTQAGILKGRLRTWDSMAIPLWGNVPQANCVQLGYYCMQLKAMRDNPEQSHGSKLTGHSDTREARLWNQRALPSDLDGAPTWKNLVSDLVTLLETFQPEVVVTPHPRIDPHPDHQAATQALDAALEQSSHRPMALLCYANHLHDNDRWPMGPAGEGIGLPPSFDSTSTATFWSFPIPPEVQRDKAMALAMQHDLQTPLPWKKRLRRHLQYWLAGRTWPQTGDSEFFRKAVRSSELFHIRKLTSQ
jgi:LmbE family N-acetylglucosaminyl deacetylase